MCPMTWHEQLKAAMVELYGSECGAELDEGDLDDYRGMSATDAAKKIIAGRFAKQGAVLALGVEVSDG